jgi:hypothetical protein
VLADNTRRKGVEYSVCIICCSLMESPPYALVDI